MVCLELKLNLIKYDTRSSEQITREITKELSDEESTIIIGGIDQNETKSVISEVKDNLFFYLSDGKVFTCKNEQKLDARKNVWGLGLTNKMFLEPFLISLSDQYRDVEDSFDIFLYTNYLDPEDPYIKSVKNVAGSLDFNIIKIRVR